MGGTEGVHSKLHFVQMIRIGDENSSSTVSKHQQLGESDFFFFYQQGVAASHDAQTQARAALGDVDGGLTAGDDGTSCRVAGQRGRSGGAALT